MRVRSGRVGRRGRDGLDEVAHLVLGEVAGDVCLADHADQVVAVDDGQPTDTALLIVARASSTESSAPMVTTSSPAYSSTVMDVTS